MYIIKPKKYKDNRGFFLESFQKQRYESLFGKNKFVQDNFSQSKKNVIRGLHLQTQKSQGKFLSVIKGKIFDIALDLRKNSKTYGM